MLDSALDCIVAMDHEGRVIEFNHAAEKTFGYSSEEALGQMMGELIVPDDMRESHRDGLARNVAGGEPRILDKRMELTGKRKNGSTLPVELTITRIADTDPPQFMGYLRDITARIEAVEEQRSLRRRLVSATDAERRRLVRDLHDGTQQRLIAVAMKLQLIRAEMDADPETADREMGEASEELLAAVDELREMARGIHPSVLTEHGLDAALEVLARRSPIPATVDAEDVSNASQLAQATAYFVVSEALTNCAKYSGAEAVEVSVVKNDDQMTVTITDDGKGGAQARPGSGLAGLDDRVKAVGGTLGVISPTDLGTTVEAVLPCAS